jgi:hypothetical protein
MERHGERHHVRVGERLPSKLGFFNNNGTPTPRFSSRYVNSLPHERFNPNAMFSPIYEEQSQEAHDGDANLSFTGRRCPLEFEAGAHNPSNWRRTENVSLILKRR